MCVFMERERDVYVLQLLLRLHRQLRQLLVGEDLVALLLHYNMIQYNIA